MKIKIIKKISQPEYTGEDRCIPCTLANIAIVVVFSTLISMASLYIGVLFFALCLVVIYFRGYLIPGTPELTKRYLPSTILVWFGKAEDPPVASGFAPSKETEETPRTEEPSQSPEGDDTEASFAGFQQENNGLEEAFVQEQLIKWDSSIQDLRLTSGFESVWSKELALFTDTEVTKNDIIDAFGLSVTSSEVKLTIDGGIPVLKSPSGIVGRWPSYAALIADIAASVALGKWTNAWEHIPSEDRGVLLNSLRMFLETCPTTNGGVEIGQATVESCCSSQEVITLRCEKTGERLFEQPVSPIDP